MPDLDPEVRDRAVREAVNIDIPDEVWDAAAEVLVDPIAPSQFKAIVQATTRAARVAILREWILDINLQRYETPEQIAKAMHVRMEWLKSGGRVF